MSSPVQPGTGTVSVVVCAYTEDRWDDLVEAVASLRCQTAPPLEIVVVVDHNPGLLERVKRYLPAAFAVRNGEERGLSGARNTGIATARGEIVAFLDDDAVADPDWVERLSRHYAAPHVIGVGGRAEADWVTGRPSTFPEEFDWVVGCTYRGMPEATTAIRNPIGANMSFRADVLWRTGGFRSGVGRVGTRPVGCEETELSIRAARAHPEGMILYEPEAKVRHRVPPGRATWRYFRSRCYAEGLSKAIVSEWVGADAGLSSERTYTFRTLPLGVLRGIAGGFRGEVAGLGRAAAIVAGLAITTAGYCAGRLVRFGRSSGRKSDAATLITGRPEPPAPVV